MTKIEAIKATLEHHKENLRLLETVEGGFVNDWLVYYFIIGKTKISYDGPDCALCQKYSKPCCWDCPLYQHGYGCNEKNSPWQKIRYSETKPEAILVEKGMIKVLEKVLRKEEAL